MTDPEFGELVDVPLRDAWNHEAHRFTPWLAENLDRLGDAIGIPLELTGTEMRCGPFSADIIARSAYDDSVVLIENQLEGSDHTHLGQIMTYLAGLETHTMIWVAPTFREEHLSAIRWLNEHTVEPFAFFAVKVRVVQIGSSPLAPLFEVVERPNNWDRQISAAKKETGELSTLGQFRTDFWTHYSEFDPETKPHGASSQWIELPGVEAVLVQYISRKGVGLFVRPARGMSIEAIRDELEPFQTSLESELGAQMGEDKYMFGTSKNTDMSERANWGAACRWLKDETDRYTAIFAEVVEGRPG